jgi:hypothetical protein
MSTISEAAVALGRLVELSILGKATIILVIGLTVVMLSRRARASVRHLLLAATLASMLALPLIVWGAEDFSDLLTQTSRPRAVMYRRVRLQDVKLPCPQSKGENHGH